MGKRDEMDRNTSASPAKKKNKEREEPSLKKSKKAKSTDSSSDSEPEKKRSGRAENNSKKKRHKHKKSKGKKPSKKKKKESSSSDSSERSDESESGSSTADSDDAQYAGAFKKNKQKSKKSKKKRSKKPKKPKKKVKSMNDMWGKHGIITDEHRHLKAPEFFAWLYDVKNIDRSNLGHKEEREYFREFAEDFNTGTFPSEKYYNLAKWQASLPSKPEGAYMDDPLLTDEEKIRLARKDQKDTAVKLNEQARIAAMVDSLRQAKAENDSGYRDIVERQMEKLKGSTFESLAKERRLRKRDDDFKELY